jgi:cytochrome c-type biogenesis protein CcmH
MLHRVRERFRSSEAARGPDPRLTTRASSARRALRRFAIVIAVLAASVAAGRAGTAYAQQLGEGMSRDGTVGIQNATERDLFKGLICTCGCPRESLATCTCGIAAERREVLRGELAKGKSLDEISAAYAKQYGPEALALPPNSGANRLVWMVPLGALVVGAGIVASTLRRWRRKSDDTVKRPPAPPADGAARDAYDEQLDEELKDLDDR